MSLENVQVTDLVFVVSKEGRPLMPCSPSRARKLLNQKKAKVIQRSPFTTPENLITLCESCHDKLHQGKLGAQISEKLKKKTQSQTKHPTEMGVIKSQIKKSNWKFQEAFGFETKFKREMELNLPKAHGL